MTGPTPRQINAPKVPLEVSDPFPASSYSTIELYFFHRSLELTVMPWLDVLRSCFTVQARREQEPHSEVLQSHVGRFSEEWLLFNLET